MDNDLITTIQSNEARIKLRAVLNSVMQGEHVTITRYNTVEAVVVPMDWYERAVGMIAADDRSGAVG
jgi:prevent-host-death family protein